MLAYSVKCRGVALAAVVSVALFALQGCSKRETAAHEGPIALGTYRATLELPGGDLPFGLDIARESDRYVAYLVNGMERVRVPDVTVSDGRIDMTMPGFENRLSAHIDGDALEGELTLVTRGGRDEVIPFAAEHGPEYRFVKKPLTDNADLSGRWSVTFTPASGAPYAAIGELDQAHHELTGTFLTPAGDHRFLAGDVHDNDFSLSTFDGANAYLYKGRIDGKGGIEGTFWSGLGARTRFAGRRTEAVELPDAAGITSLRADADELNFSFPDLEGKPVSLRDARFAGKVVIVVLGGSWSATFHDEAAFLAPYYLQNRERGLEIVALLFEHSGELQRATAAARRFQEKLSPQHAVLIAGTSDKADAARRLPQLNGVFAFPTTLFLDRRGRVRRIHTGFTGPAAGAHYQELIEDFDSTVEQLLAETGDNAMDAPAEGP